MGIKIWWESLLIGGFFLVVGKRMSKFLASAGLLPIPCLIRKNPPMLSQFGPKWENFMMTLCKAFFHLSILLSWGAILWQKTKLTIVNFPPKKYPRPIFPPKLCSPVFCDGHIHKYQTQLCILTKLKKFFLWITSVCPNFRHSNFSHCRNPWLRKYLLQGRVFF